MLITDAMSATGMPEGVYQLGPIEVVVKDGKATANGSLAGSVLTMDRAVRNVTQFSDWSLRNAVAGPRHSTLPRPSAYPENTACWQRERARISMS